MSKRLPIATAAIVATASCGATEHPSSGGSFLVAWPPIAGAVSYRLEERAAESTWREIQRGPQTSRALADKPAGVWEYRVRACDARNECASYSPLPSVRVD